MMKSTKHKHKITFLSILGGMVAVGTIYGLWIRPTLQSIICWKSGVNTAVVEAKKIEPIQESLRKIEDKVDALVTATFMVCDRLDVKLPKNTEEKMLESVNSHNNKDR